MRSFFLGLLTLLFSLPLFSQGHLIIIGGGPRPESVMKKFVELAGKDSARIVIIPMASEFYRESGENYVEEFKKLGVNRVLPLYVLSREEANLDTIAAALKNASGIFFGGGDQNRLTRLFLDTKAFDAIHAVYRRGGVIGGTSAGAAIMSELMITGDGNWEYLCKDSVKVSRGFGFVKNVVIDQHFVRRNRLNRLIAVCIQNRVSGIGIDESTAIWVKPDFHAEVLGNFSIVLLNLQQAIITKTASGLLTARKIRLDILKAGDVFSLWDLFINSEKEQ